MKDFFVDVIIFVSFGYFGLTFIKCFGIFSGISSSSDVKVILDEVRKYVTQCLRGSDRSAIREV